jgi:hypothetical protein
MTAIVDDGTGRPQQQGPTPTRGPDVPGVTRGYRYNELIGTQGGLTALQAVQTAGCHCSSPGTSSCSGTSSGINLPTLVPQLVVKAPAEVDPPCFSSMSTW